MPESTQFGPLSDLVARCVLAYERGGDEAVETELAAQLELAGPAREQLDALRRAGLLVAPEQPTSLGPYRVVRQLGSGGMGTVWLCDQEEPVRRQVAVKVLRPGIADAEMLVRFQLERQALARLTDPCIARVLDAGVTADRRPYLVIDYVPGTAITQFCDERRLPLRARLELFARLCDAVQHAHHKGIVHRDLKPGNVLVVERDGEPLPVVIDFGVAKSVSTVGSTVFTIEGKLLGTPEYMSPEQARGEPDIDTRTDVYSLGVLLYELVSGTLPIDSTRLRNLIDIGRVLDDFVPPRASARIAALADIDRTRVAQARGTTPTVLERELRREPDWILLRAIEKDRNRRYGTAAELALDVRRLLAHEPVAASPPSRWLAARRFCARNRLPMTALATAALLLCGLTATSLWFWRDAAAAERTASATSAQLVVSLDGALAALDGMVSLGVEGLRTPESEPMRRELLRTALALHERLLATTPASPRLDAALALALARAAQLRQSLGETVEAKALLRRAEERILAIPTGTPAANDAGATLGDACSLCGRLCAAFGEPGAAADHLRRALAAYDAIGTPAGTAHSLAPRLDSTVQLADVMTATDVAAARDLLMAAMASAQGLLAAPDTTFDERQIALHALARLAWLHCETRDPQAARELLGQVVKTLCETPLDTLTLTNQLTTAKVLTQCVTTAIRLWDNHDVDLALPRLIAILRAAVAAEPSVPSHRRDLAVALMHLALLRGDEDPPATVIAIEHEALAMFDIAAAQDDSTNTAVLWIDALLDIGLRRIDWLVTDEEHRRAVDLGEVRTALAKAEAAHAKLPEVMLQDRHVRESWLGSFRVRAALLQAAGDGPGAVQALTAALHHAEELLADHPDVVQVRLIAGEVANGIADAIAATDPRAAFGRATTAASHLAAAAPRFANERWPRLWSQLTTTTRLMSTMAADSTPEDRRTALACLATCATAARTVGRTANATTLDETAAAIRAVDGGR